MKLNKLFCLGAVICASLMAAEVVEAQTQPTIFPLPGPGALPPGAHGAATFLSVSNVQSYINNANTTIFVTNGFVGLTNLMAGGTTNVNPNWPTWLDGAGVAKVSTTLFTTWWNPVNTNGLFIVDTNGGIYDTSGRYTTIQLTGTVFATNGVAGTLWFVGSSYNPPNNWLNSYGAPQTLFDTVPTVLAVTYNIPANASAFSYTTNIETDGLGAMQLVFFSNTGAGAITNPAVRITSTLGQN